ncbi:hypothetical protein ACAW74_20645 [Fibrella sp. WM1]|uniref:hypothetical protein n=1 Tax=Fibrella musci TaxID=3242485 RepID=UPI0035229C71
MESVAEKKQQAEDNNAARGRDMAAKFTHIKGWGIDMNPKNDPTYPIKDPRTDVEQEGYTWQRPTQQAETVEILHSNERPNLSAVFGTVAPPSGLSGMLRRYAFTHSESRLMHWIPLVVADRINVVEGIIDDLMHGTVPNIPKEKGLKADLEVNQTGLATKVLVTALIATAVVGLFAYSRNDRSLRRR